MSLDEKNLAIQILEKIKQLLKDVLGEVEKLEATVKTAKPLIATSEVSKSLGEHSQYVDVQDLGEMLVVKPKKFLGGKIFGEIQDKLKPLGFVYVSNGKNSRWIKQK